MSGITKTKICVDCNGAYTPTSNVQKRCQACADKHKALKDVRYREKKKQGGQPVSRLAHNQEKVSSTLTPATKAKPIVFLCLLKTRADELRAELSAVDTLISTIETATT